jgi:hypothetical protein
MVRYKIIFGILWSLFTNKKIENIKLKKSIRTPPIIGLSAPVTEFIAIHRKSGLKMLMNSLPVTTK